MKETRFNLNAEVMKDEDDKNTKKLDRPTNEEKKKTNELSKKATRSTSGAKTTQGQNEAGPSQTRSRKTDRSTDDKKELTSTTSFTSLITKQSIKSIKSETHRDVIDCENKPNTIEGEQPDKPLYVDISGKNLSKKETVQILNKYSSIFVDNVKDPVPKDPLSYRRESDDVSTPLPGTSAGAPDLAARLSEIGSQHFRQTPNPSVYASPTPQQRPVSESQSTESVVERIHHYEDESTNTSQISGRTSVQEKKSLSSKSKSGRFVSPKISLKHLSEKSGTSKKDSSAESSKKDSSKRSYMKQDPAKTNKQEGSSNQQDPKPDSEPSHKDAIFHTRHIAVSNLDAERITMRLEKLGKDNFEYKQPPEFECEDEDEDILRPNSAVEKSFSPRRPITCSLGRPSPCRLEELRRPRMNPPPLDSFKSSPSRISRDVFPSTRSSRKERLSAERVVGNLPVTSPPSPARGNRGTKR